MEREGSLPLLQQLATCLILSQINPVHASHPTSWRSILILSSHLSLSLTSALSPSGFPTKTLSAPLLSPIRATCSAHLILLDLITRVIFGEEWRSVSSSLLSFPYSPLISSPLYWNHKKYITTRIVCDQNPDFVNVIAGNIHLYTLTPRLYRVFHDFRA